MDLTLVDPTPDLATEFRAMAKEWQAAGNPRFDAAFGDFAEYVRRLERQKEPERLHPNLVPSTTFWLLTADGRIVGTSRLRHWLVPHLEKEGGHIGYNIRPSERRKGYGTAILALTLVKAWEHGLREVLVTCDTDNVASARIIEKNGGQFIGHSVSDDSGKQVSRYRIVMQENE